MIFTFKGVDFIFDDQDSHLLEGDYIWSIDSSGHLRRGESAPDGIYNIGIHRIIMNVSNPKEIVDHIDRNPRNNRRNNLRITDHLGNSRNVSKWSKPTSSKHKGVSVTEDGMYLMSIRTGIDKIGRIRERYDNEDIAGYVYSLYAVKYFGEFASLNNVQEFTEKEIANSSLKRFKNNIKNSPHKGISWKEKSQHWLAQFYYKKVRYRVGVFDTENEAYEALINKKIEMGIL